MRPVDDLDLAILAELEANARAPVSELARRLGSPNSTIRDRIRKLEEDGVIRGYSAILDPEKLGLNLKAILQVTWTQSVPPEDTVTRPAQLPEVVHLQILTGDIDELITVYARNVEDLKRIIYSKFEQLPGLAKLSTAIVLEERRFPLTECLKGSRSKPTL